MCCKMLTAKRKPNSSNSVTGVYAVTVLLIHICIFNFEQSVDASCISVQGKIGECIKFEECHSAVFLSQNGVNPGYCSLEEGTVCCADYKNVAGIGRIPSNEDQSKYFQNTPLGLGGSHAKDTFESDSNIQRKKNGAAKSVGNNNRGKKKNSDIIDEPYKFETLDTYYVDGEVTFGPDRRAPPPNSQNEEGNFVPPGQAKKKGWRDEKTSENDYSFERVTKKPPRGPNHKGSNKHTGGNREPNNSRKGIENNTQRSEYGGKRLTSNSCSNQNECGNNYENKRTTPKNNNWGQGTYTSTIRPDYFGTGSGYINSGIGNTYFNQRPTRRPDFGIESGYSNSGNGNTYFNQRPTRRPETSSSASNYNTNRPIFPESLPQDSNFPSYQQGSRPDNKRPNYSQGSNFEGNRPVAGSGPQRRNTISEQKCEEYSKQVTKNITSLPLTTIPDPVTISVTKCITPQQLIVGGENTTLGEFPHMAAIGFRDLIKKQILWNCGGTLISEFYVLTAGHCTSTSSGRPVKVRLGEYNLMKNDDGAHPVEYTVVKIITHPEWKPPSKYNDIALLKLSRAVTFHKHIRPACLYSESTFPASRAIATGWGRIHYEGKTSEVLQKVVLSIIDNPTCNGFYKLNIKTEVLAHGIVDSQMCAGELSGGKDTCQGDSGGPLSITSASCIHHIIGITSFGKSCALPNSTGVYTRVSAYVPWIESVVWPTDRN